MTNNEKLNHIKRIINSCETITQLETCFSFVDKNFFDKDNIEARLVVCGIIRRKLDPGSSSKRLVKELDSIIMANTADLIFDKKIIWRLIEICSIQEDRINALEQKLDSK